MTRPATGNAVPDTAAATGDEARRAELDGLRALVDHQQHLVEEQAREIERLRPFEFHWAALRASPSWQLLRLLQDARALALPAGSRRERLLEGRAGALRAAAAGAVGRLTARTEARAVRGERTVPGETAEAPRPGGAPIHVAAVALDEPDATGLVDDPWVLAGLAARLARSEERAAYRAEGRVRFAGRRVLFLVPLAEQGGGANVVLREGQAMREMGVTVELFNLSEYRASFLAGYPDIDLPIHFGEAGDAAELGRGFDAVVATASNSVRMLPPARRDGSGPVAGYYIQDFEPYFFAPGSARNAEAWASYTARPDLVRFTKSAWNRDELRRRTGAESVAVGPSVDLDLFRPRRRAAPAWPDGPVRVAAMVRPASLVRQATQTMRVLRELERRFGSAVEIILFGVAQDDPSLLDLPHDFAWRPAGLLRPAQVARLFNDIDVFADVSLYQALGLSSLEAMACGVAVVAPIYGAGGEFIRHAENGLLADPRDAWDFLRNVDHLVASPEDRRQLGRRALDDVCAYYPEGPALRILEALFDRPAQA